MEDKNKFQEMLNDILEIARVQGNHLTTQEVRKLFGDMKLNEAQYEHIFAYLAANHIKIAGYMESVSEYTKVVQQELQESEETDLVDNQVNEEELSNKTEKKLIRTMTSNQEQEDSVYLKMYLKDLNVIKSVTPKEDQELIQKILLGDIAAKNRFIEINLKYVIDIANKYRNQGVILEDLIQEGNIGLMNALENLAELSDKKAWKEFITNYISQSIEAAIQEQKDSSSFENKIVEKIKFINDAANELAEDLGRKADIHELAGYTKLSEKEIQDILNMTKDAVKLGNHNHSNEL
jgi:RNA polymerase primary sigma factor